MMGASSWAPPVRLLLLLLLLVGGLLHSVAAPAPAATACKDTAELVEYVRERVAGLEDVAVAEVVAALQKSPSCITSDVLEERERCGDQGLHDAIRAVQVFALGLDAVPAPIRPSPVPCVQIPSFPEIVVLEWSHQPDSLMPVRSFGVQRERVGGGGSQAEMRNLTMAEFEKCRNKGNCTFKDQIEPGQRYIYSVTATNALGSSSAVEIFCATHTDLSKCYRGIRADDEAVGATSDDQDKFVDFTSMSVASTVAWCVVSAVVAIAITVFLLDRAVVNGSSHLCDTISRRMNSRAVKNAGGVPQQTAARAERGRFESLLQEAYRWNSMIFLAIVYGIGIWMWLPVEKQLLPALRQMALTAQQYIEREMVCQADGGEDHTSHEVFAAVQGSGPSVKLVADSYKSFLVSAYEWERGLLALHNEQRITINGMVDGTAEIWEPETMVLFLCCLLLFAYVLELLVWTKWLWEGTQLKGMLQYTSRITPGCKLGRYLYPLCCLGCWRTYAVIDTAIALATNMGRNVKQLKKLADCVPHNEDMARIRAGLDDIVSRRHGLRWGITLGRCAGGPCHIDMTFWKVGTSTMKYIVVPLIFVIPLVLLCVRIQKNNKEMEEQEELIKQQKEAHEQVKQLAKEKERLYTRARDEALTQQQRLEAEAKARRAEQEERDAIKAEQQLMMREIKQRDLSVLWEDGQDAPPDQRKNDWRRCEISEGAAGQICRAWCEGTLRKKVAIKRLKPNAPMLQRSFSTLRTTSGRLDLTDEQKFFLYLQHDNIAKCYGTLQENGVQSIVMELCKCDLRHWLSNDAFWTGKTQLEIDDHKMDAIRQVSQALQFLHDKHVIHLDLKCGNILLEMLDDGTAGSTWKLCDFGESMRLHKGENQVVDTHLYDTHDKRKITAEIASPERFDGQGVGMKTDIYAFGCVMWSILTRLELWHWCAIPRVIEKAVGIDAKRPRCPESQLTDMIRLCMHHNAAMRPTSQQLSKWAHKQGGRARRSSRSTRSRISVNDSILRMLEVPSEVLLGDANDSSWAASIPGLRGCECTPVPPVHGCEFHVTCNENNTGHITIQTTHHRAEELVTEEAVHALFDDCDEDGSGALDKAELRRMLERGGIEWSKQLKQEFEGEWSNLANDGEVDFQSFFHWWTTAPTSDQRSHLRRELHRAGMFTTKRVNVQFPCTVMSGWIVTNSSRSTGLSWNVNGQYIAKHGSTSREQWEEEALQGTASPRNISQEKDDEEKDTQVTIRAVFNSAEKPGIIFGDDWPYVRRIKSGSPAHGIPGLQKGCKLLRIESLLSAEGGDAVVEGEAVLMAFNDAKPHIAAERSPERPLVLIFAAAAVAET